MAGNDGRDQSVAALYAVPPAQFVEARDEEVRAAKQRGDPETARWLAGLRRPTVAAWLVNELYRLERDAVESLLELGEQLVEASRVLSGPALSQLSTQRSQVVQALVARARRIAADAGVAVNAAVSYDVQQTLEAALADAGVANEVRSGRMLRPASYAGFGPAPSAEAAPSKPRTKPRPGPRETSGGAGRDKARARKKAEQLLAEAEAVLQEATREAAQRETALSEARRLCQVLKEDHEALLAQLADLEQRQQQAVVRAETAEKEAAETATRRERAQSRVSEARDRLSATD